MPIINPEETPESVEQPNAVKTVAPAYRGVTVDTRYEPQQALLTHLEGSAWTVNYYSQVLDDDNQVAGQNTGLSPVHQQYQLVRGFELKVTSPLQTSQNTETNSLALTGAANVYPFLIPNVGDMFLADIGDGREAIFRITLSERLSVFKETVHRIEYTIIDYSTAERLWDFKAKTVRTVQFVKDFLMHGQNPLLEEDDYAIAKKLVDHYWEIMGVYFKAFTSSEYKTLMVPGQVAPVHDHFLTNTVLKFFDTRQAEELRHIRRMNVQDDDAMKSTTVWDVLSQKAPRLLKHSVRRAGLVSARSFERNPMLEGIYYTGISYVVYPKDPSVTVDYQPTDCVKPLAVDVLVDVPSRIATLKDLMSFTTLNGLPYDDAPLIHPVTVDDFYVLSKAFYDGEPGQSKLELCIRDYVDGKAPNNKLLLAFCETYHAWGGLERFYYVPLVLLLIKASIRSL